MALKLKSDNDNDSAHIKISVEKGYPKRLEHVTLANDDLYPELTIGCMKQEILQLEKASSLVSNLLIELSYNHRWKEISQGNQLCLSQINELAKYLLNNCIDPGEIAKKLLNIRDDVLGCYFYTGRIEIYWMVISIFSKLISASVVSLTIVVLIHEFVHAYSHLGKDIDGESWAKDYKDVDVNIKEGVAQYYTDRISHYVNEINILSAYENLLKHQSGPYVIHTNWTKCFNKEMFRAAVIECRKNGILTINQFEYLLREASLRLNDED